LSWLFTQSRLLHHPARRFDLDPGRLRKFLKRASAHFLQGQACDWAVHTDDAVL
jgi:hypothetical protein